MSGTRAGAQRAKATIFERYGEKFFSEIGRRGGQNGCGPDYKGGFAADHERARIAGAKGGRISRRTGVKNNEGKN